MSESANCTRHGCDSEATMTLDLIVKIGDHGELVDQHFPYCDSDLGWFYRSFSRNYSDVEVRGITILSGLV